MAKTENLIGTTTLTKLKPANKGDLLKDGGGLRGQVYVDSSDKITVVFTYSYRSPETGRQREKGCGVYPAVSLSAIRDERDRLRGIVRGDITKGVAKADPLEQERREREAIQAEQQEAERIKRQAEADALAVQHQQEAERKAAEQVAAEPTMQDLFEQWDANYGATLATDWRETRRSNWRCHVAPLVGKQKIKSASKSVLMAHYDSLMKAGKAKTAKDALALVRQVMKWGIQRGLVPENHPLATMELPEAVRTVKTTQMAENFSAAEYVAKHGLDAIGEDAEDGKAGRALPFSELVDLLSNKLTVGTQSETGKCVIRFMLATGVRASQALKLRWDWVLLEHRVIIFPAGSMKAKKMHHVHLSDYALGVLKQMNAIRINDFVFPAPKKANAAVLRSNVGNDIASRQFYSADDETEVAYQARLAERMTCRRTRADFELYNLSGGKWTLYDLRRTTATRLCELTGSDWETIEKVLAHAEPHGVTGRYVRLSKWEDRCNALNLLGAALAECAAGVLPNRVDDNVVQLRRA
ncbi:tyrosine-type recombinase/integrase [Deefgea piscis]|uniref:tyrosine-type recombinase/integrase n=1 Tax=Deefgea piscis TaxID=2739061 RepID=UPI001C7E65FE|nr:tyrosine-type recombinase/integrase [Deefgea piscis]QZA82554.1 tyrosine-type recombinase/integrase [Deefgea piscis]